MTTEASLNKGHDSWKWKGYENKREIIRRKGKLKSNTN